MSFVCLLLARYCSQRTKLICQVVKPTFIEVIASLQRHRSLQLRIPKKGPIKQLTEHVINTTKFLFLCMMETSKKGARPDREKAVPCCTKKDEAPVCVCRPRRKKFNRQGLSSERFIVAICMWIELNGLYSSARSCRVDEKRCDDRHATATPSGMVLLFL